MVCSIRNQGFKFDLFVLDEISGLIAKFSGFMRKFEGLFENGWLDSDLRFNNKVAQF
jgi:hypothetical protein